MSFVEFNLSSEVMKAVEELGFEEPTPIQQQAIGPLLAGRDLLGQAQTGTGKTAAFAIPIIERIDTTDRGVQALILAPTRELAVQVAEHTHRLGRHHQVSVLPIYGGQSYERQFRGLHHGAQVVVGTPGRVMDHLRRETLDLSQCKFVILDEADQMLDLGFIEDVEWILQHAPKERQTALFSATIPPKIAALARTYLKDPVQISVARERITVPQTDLRYVEVRQRDKLDALTRILDTEAPEAAIIFCRTKRDVDDLGESLAGRGYSVETIHGDLTQTLRERVLRRFRDGQVEILVATDVAARGLDIQGVSHVVNYDIPEDPEVYVHRIGRTGRAGREGCAITLVSAREIGLLRMIERVIGRKVKPMRLPTMADVSARRMEAFRAMVRQTIIEGGLEPYLLMIEDLREEYDMAEIAAATAKLAADTAGKPITVAEAPQEDDGVGAEPGMVRLFLNIGRRAGIRPGDLVGAIANEADIPGRAVGSIDIYDTYSFVEVPADKVDRVITALSHATVRGRRIHLERADSANGRTAPANERQPRGEFSNGRPSRERRAPVSRY